MPTRPDKLTTTALAPTPCPACGVPLAHATGTEPPTPGGVTLCGHCWVYLIFTVDLGVRRLSDGEWLALPPARREFLTQLRDVLRQHEPPTTHH